MKNLGVTEWLDISVQASAMAVAAVLLTSLNKRENEYVIKLSTDICSYQHRCNIL
jgi:hypothetical protein